MIEDVLESKEMIIVKLAVNHEAQGQKYDKLAVTNKRLIFYKRTGLIFKKDTCSSIGYSQLGNVNYKEKGVIRKKGELTLILKGSKPIIIEGKPSEIKYIYQNIVSQQ